MEQSLLNWIYGIANLALGFAFKWIYDAHKEFRNADKDLADKVSKIEILVAGQYVTRDELDRNIQRIFDKLDHIEMKIQK